jgi:hypothetical protein
LRPPILRSRRSCRFRTLIVTTEDFAYHLIPERNVVRKIKISSFYKAIFDLFYQFDVPLRKTRTLLAANTPNDLKVALGYSEQLCKDYGIKVDDSDLDQAFRNTLGHKTLEVTLLYIQIEKALFKNEAENFIVKATKDTEEMQGLLEVGFEYVCQKDGLMFFRKRK